MLVGMAAIAMHIGVALTVLVAVVIPHDRVEAVDESLSTDSTDSPVFWQPADGVLATPPSLLVLLACPLGVLVSPWPSREVPLARLSVRSMASRAPPRVSLARACSSDRLKHDSQYDQDMVGGYSV